MTGGPVSAGENEKTPPLAGGGSAADCGSSFGVTLSGSPYSESENVFESPLTLDSPVTAGEIHCYSNQPEKLMAGLYDSSQKLLKSVSWKTRKAGWVQASFPITLTQGSYYLAVLSDRVFLNLIVPSNVGTLTMSRQKTLPDTFVINGGNPNSAVPAYLSGCAGAPVATATPTFSPTPIPNPCTYSYGVTTLGKDQPEAGNAIECPLVLSSAATIQGISLFSSQAETITAGVYDSSNTLMKSVTIVSSLAGWYSADFPVTLKAAKYYLGRFGTGNNVNLAGSPGSFCPSAKTGKLPEKFKETGKCDSAALPLYLTGCKPMTITGTVYGAGDSIMAGEGSSAPSKRFLNILTSWLNTHYGPVTEINDGHAGTGSDALSANIESEAGNSKFAVCVIIIGEINFELVPGAKSLCGGIPLSAGIPSAMSFAEDLQHTITVLKKHLTPGGTIMILNNYDISDFMEIMHPGWTDYGSILSVYNMVTSVVAKANGVKLVDCYTLFQEDPHLRNPQQIHPNDDGQAAIAYLLEKSLEN